jgi:hypothetical protein
MRASSLRRGLKEVRGDQFLSLTIGKMIVLPEWQ